MDSTKRGSGTPPPNKTNGGKTDGGKTDGGKVEGEGSYTATRAYNQHLAGTVQSGTVDQRAQEARQAIDGPEGDELRRAEAEGKRHARPGSK